MHDDKAGESRVHLSGYQARDWDVTDYRMYELEGTGLQFRGPAPDLDDEGSFVAYLGAAQTFGCFCDRPFCELVHEELGLPPLNLGYGGAGPEFFAGQPGLIDKVNRAKLVVIQVMSGRSQSNSLYECGGLEYLRRRSDGKRMGADEGYREVLDGPAGLRALGWPGRKLARLLGRRRVIELARETRERWLESNRRLIAMIDRPVVLLWFSKRTPEYAAVPRTVYSLFGDFPQLINREMIDSLRGEVDHYVECVTERGSPQPLTSRFTGEPVTVDPANDRPDLGGSEPWTHNRYYPSPEMHEDAARTLVPLLRELA